jgi:hypothetical protein
VLRRWSAASCGSSWYDEAWKGSHDPDLTLVRHIHDLHMMRERADPPAVAALARPIGEADAQQFIRQYPGYAANSAGDTRKAVAALLADPVQRQRYDVFVAGMVCGEPAECADAIGSVVAVVLPSFGPGPFIRLAPDSCCGGATHSGSVPPHRETPGNNAPDRRTRRQVRSATTVPSTAA